LHWTFWTTDWHCHGPLYIARIGAKAAYLFLLDAEGSKSIKSILNWDWYEEFIPARQIFFSSTENMYKSWHSINMTRLFKEFLLMLIS
jgi:hypothetical protein